ncbi:MAG: PD-(D/E)XK nuclease family protein [Actinomycetota bacterium]
MEIPADLVLAPEQERTLRQLIGLDERPAYDPSIAEDLRDRLVAGIGDRTTPGGVWIGKTRVTEWAQCEGLLAADLHDELPEFEHDEKSAIGAVLHRAIQADVELLGPSRGDGSERVFCAYAVERLTVGEKADEAFAAYWTACAEDERARVLASAQALLATFRRIFPPLGALRQTLKPSAEFRVKATLGTDVVRMSGVVDLALGAAEAPPKGDGPPPPPRATRLLIDHKTGGAYRDHVEDLRFYALLHTLHRGAPPYRIASYYAGSGEWQAEDIAYEILEHAADRAASAARRAIDLLEGDEPELRAGPWCGWCPRAAGCPARAAADAAGAAPTA